MTVEGDMMDAFRAGEKAVAEHRPRAECPYEEGALTSRERVLRTMWLRGWSSGNPLSAQDD